MKCFGDNKGTTLIEALVTVVIFSLGMIPSLTIVLLASSFSLAIQNNLIAANLAQEGVEIAQAIRDANKFNNRVFDFGLAPGSYRVEWDSTALLEVSDNPALKIDSSSGLYSYDTAGTDTAFNRKITITKDPSLPGCNCELKVKSEVTWPERGKIKTLIVESHLFDWL